MRVEYTYHDNGNYATMTTINVRTNMFDGLYRKWDEQGFLQVECTYVNGEKHGVERVWHPSSTAIQSKYTFVNNLHHGVARVWYESGQLCLEENYFEGKLHGKQLMWDRQGKLLHSIQYHLGEKNGLVYGVNGKCAGHYVDGKKDGEWYENDGFYFYKYGELLTTDFQQVCYREVVQGSSHIHTFTFENLKLTEEWFRNTILLKRYWSGTGKRDEWSLDGRLIKCVYVCFDETETLLERGSVYEYYESGQLAHTYYFVKRDKVGMEEYYDEKGVRTLTVNHNALQSCRFKEIRSESFPNNNMRCTYTVADCCKKHGWERVWNVSGSYQSQSYYVCGDKVYEQIF